MTPMAGIPADVACPHCGGYVRGHQFIGPGDCSINRVFEEPITEETVINMQVIIDSSVQRWSGSIYTLKRPE